MGEALIVRRGGGGGTGGTLVVTAPIGVTVTATNSVLGKTTTRVANYEGIATFRGLATGTWTVNCTDGIRVSESVDVVINADYATTLAFFSATINVTYPSGSQLTCTDGTTTFTATTSTGYYSFIVPNAGTWTVSCVSGSQTDSEAVTITAAGETKSVTLSYFTATINITYPATSTCVVKNSSGATVASNSNTGSSATTWAATVTATDTYTVTATATDGSGNTKSSSVSITSNGQSASVTLDYFLYLYNNGDLCTATTGGWNYTYFSGYNNTASHSTNNGLYLACSSNGTGVHVTNNLISKGKYTKLNVQVSEYWVLSGYTIQVIFGAYSTKSVINMENNKYANVKPTSTGIFSVDISGVSSSFYVVFGLQTNYQARTNAIKVWLS